MKFKQTYVKHLNKCDRATPPGRKIYSDREVDFLNKTASSFLKL